MLLNLKIALTRPNAKVPEYKSMSAAGADLHAALTDEQMPCVEIKPGRTVNFYLGFKTEFDPGYAAFIYPRSGLSIKCGCAPANKVGVIDADYRGEWCVALHNHGDTTQIVEEGDRIAQVIFKEVEHPEFIVVDESELSKTERGEGKFGSTGK